MYIDAYVGGRRYGGYDHDAFTVILTKESSQIEVKFQFEDSRQNSGSFRVGPGVARWLAWALLAAAEGYAKRLPLRVQVRSDDIIVQK